MHVLQNWNLNFVITKKMGKLLILMFDRSDIDLTFPFPAEFQGL